MNAYLDTQTSGNKWGPTMLSVLSHVAQETEYLPSQQESASVLSAFDEQKALISGATAEHELVVAEIRKHYALEDYSSAVAFFYDHRFIPEILLAAAPELRRCFGAETVFQLRVSIDESGSRTMYATARWFGSIADAQNAIDEFDTVWWIGHSQEAAGYLNFTYELM